MAISSSTAPARVKRTHATRLALVAGLAGLTWCACSREAHEPASAPNESGNATPAATASTEAPAPAGPATDGAPSPAGDIVIRTLDLGDELKVDILREGTNRKARLGDTLLVRYEARVKDAEQPFATTRGLYQPQRFVLDAKSDASPLPALSRALVGLDQGTRARVHVPAALGYGKAGLPSSGVPADAELVFEIELVEVR